MNMQHCLALEWRRLLDDRRNRAVVASWHFGTDCLGDVLDLVGYRHRGQDPAEVIDDDIAQHNLRRLLEIAATDRLAARVVLERLVPGLLALARRRREPDAFVELVGAAWEAIVSFNLARRPAHLVVALLADCEYVAYRREARRRRIDVVDVAVDESFAAPSVTPAWEELTGILTEADRVGALDDGDRLLLSSLLSERSSRETAVALGTCERTVRYRRADLVDRLRQVAQCA